jgi:hypothetical protein
MEPKGSLPCTNGPSTVPILSQINPVHTTSHAIVMSEPALHIHRTFHVTNLISIFLSLGRLSKESVHVRRHSWHFVTKLFLRREMLSQSWRITPWRLSATAYSIYSQLPSILEAVSSIRNLRTLYFTSRSYTTLNKLASSPSGLHELGDGTFLPIGSLTPIYHNKNSCSFC